MKMTGIVTFCDKCGKEFEIFSDDGAGDQTAVWNWCPFCGTQKHLWIRFLRKNEKIASGIGAEEAQKIREQKIAEMKSKIAEDKK